MSDILSSTYEFYEKKLQALFDDVSETKKMLNRLAKDLGRDSVPYPDVAPEGTSTSSKIKAGQFFSKPLATAVREYLEIRREAVEWPEIVKALREGSFDLAKTRQGEDDARMTILRNTANFVLIGDNHFGLKSWYPKLKKDKETAKADSNSKKRVEVEIEKETSETKK